MRTTSSSYDSDRETVCRVINGVDGWLTLREALALYFFAKKGLEKGDIVEIGSWKGRSTICMALALKMSHPDSRRVYAIDTFEGSPEQSGAHTGLLKSFVNNLRKYRVEDVVTPCVSTSSAAIQDPRVRRLRIGLLFIDGRHEYEYVKQDLINYSPLVVDGGFVALHDACRWNVLTPSLGFQWEGAARVAQQYIFPSERFKVIGFFESLLVAESICRPLTSLERMNKSSMFAVFLLKAAIARWITWLLNRVNSRARQQLIRYTSLCSHAVSQTLGTQ